MKYRIVGVVFLGLWVAGSVCAIGGMFRLWWMRERELYLGKGPVEQRKTVLQRAGLTPEVVEEAVRQTSHWPPDVHYSLKGGGHNRSYIAYLLAPRIPSGRDEHQVCIEHGIVTVKPAGSPGAQDEISRDTRQMPFGWLASIALISGLGYLAWRCLPLAHLNHPEATAVTSAVLAGLAVVSKLLLRTAVPGMAVAAAAGCVGVVLFLKRLLQKTDSEKTAMGTSLQVEPVGKWHSGVVATAMLLAGAFTLLSLLFAVTVVVDDWDAWAIWGPRRRFWPWDRENSRA